MFQSLVFEVAIMKIHFIGLSCFLIENQKGFRILVDPFNDSPEWLLGPLFPKTFQGKSFGANIVLMSEPDADHAYAPGSWLQNAPLTKPNSNPFPDLNLRGTVIYEYSGDVNIAWHYSIDGLRLAHFADNSHLLTDKELKEIGTPDIVFIAPPKTESNNTRALNVTRTNIELLRPKIILWAHHIAPRNLPTTEDPKILRHYFMQYFKNNGRTNKNYNSEKHFLAFYYIFKNAIILNKEYSGTTLTNPSIEIKTKIIRKMKTKPISILFKSMLSSSLVE